jgi:hypothetical protein
MRRRLDECQHGRSVGWCDRDQPLTRFNVCVECNLKSKRVDVETEASLLIPDVDIDCVHPQERIARALLLRESFHRRDYKEPEKSSVWEFGGWRLDVDNFSIG